MNLFQRVFSVEALTPKHHMSDEFPSTKEVYETTLRMAWPSAMEAVLISMIGAMDMIMVSSLGSGAIAAVGITTQPKYFLMCFVFAVNTGVTVIISRRKGAKDKVGANLALRNGLMVSFMVTLIVSILGFIYAEPFLVFAGAQASYLPEALVYFRIIIIGGFFYLLSLTITAAQRGVGNTRISLATNLTANLVNIFFNWLLLFGIWIFPRWGVMGAAVATAIGNFAGLVLAIRSITKKDSFLQLHLRDKWTLDKPTLRTMWSISSSSLVEQVFIRIGFLMYAKAVAGLGTIEFATHNIAMQVMSITFSVGDGLSIACTALVGHSLGAKRPDLAILYGRVSQRLGLMISLALGFTIVLLRAPIMSLFSVDPKVLTLGENIVIILAICVVFQISQVITVGSLRGAGDVKFVAMLSMISVTVLRPLLTYLMAYGLGMGLYGAWFSVIVDQGLRFVVSRARFQKAEWTKIIV
jgi:putative MATE family efflux protein